MSGVTGMRNETAVADSRAPLLAWAGLAILMVFYLLSFLDKQMLSLLANPIGEALRLSDTSLGFVQGVAFSLTYSLGTIAAGIAVDRVSPRLILLVGVAGWSVASAAGGLAQGYGGLMASRMLVGLGEGVLAPVAVALIVGMFPRRRLASVMGIYAVGSNVGGVTALLLGSAAIGWLTSSGGMSLPLVGYRAPWQAALIVTGLPGIVLALLVLGVRPSVMGRYAAEAAPATDGRVTLFGVMRRNPWVFLCHFTMISLMGMIAYTMISWSPAYFGRAFGWSHRTIGLVLASGVAAGGVGNIVWGLAADALRRSDGLYRVFGVLVLLGVPLAVLEFMTPSAWLVMVLNPVVWVLLNSWGSLAVAAQLLIPDGMRGRVAALQNVLLGVFGIGLGPLVVGMVSQGLGGRAHLGAAVAVVVGVSGVLAVVLLAVGASSFRRLADARETARGVAGLPDGVAVDAKSSGAGGDRHL